MIQSFEHVNQPLRLVDMPGYGFSKAPSSRTASWDSLMGTYFQSRSQDVQATLAASLGSEVEQQWLMVFVLIDCRRGLGDMDKIMLELILEHGITHEVVFTKTDQLPTMKVQEVLQQAIV